MASDHLVARSIRKGQRGGHYEPKEGDKITILLPDERTRAVIHKMTGEGMCIAKLETFTVQNKSHNYRKGDLVPARLRPDDMGQTNWIAIDERELQTLAGAKK